MLRYLIAIAVVLLVARWLLTRRSARARLVPAGPDNVVQPGTLRTLALLTGPDFDDDDGDDPQSMGRPLAHALQQGLIVRGLCAGEPCESSHGFEVRVTIDNAVLDVHCGLRGGAEDEDTNEWLVSVMRPPPSRADYFPAENTANARKLVSALRDVIEAIPGLRRVRWCADDQRFARGVEDWHERPF